VKQCAEDIEAYAAPRRKCEDSTKRLARRARHEAAYMQRVMKMRMRPGFRSRLSLLSALGKGGHSRPVFLIWFRSAG